MADLSIYSKAVQDVVEERVRQIHEEGWSHAHDDQHVGHELANAAGAYALTAAGYNPTWILKQIWTWAPGWFKPKTSRQDLVRAAALAIAEIERLDRAEARKAQPPTKPAE